MAEVIMTTQEAFKRNPVEDKYDFETIHSSTAYNEARIKEERVVLPEENQLQIDIDNEAAFQTFLKNFDRFEAHIERIQNVEIKPSRSGNPERRHITLTLEKEVDAETRILFQLLLGSDVTREFLSFIRVTHGDPHPTLFIEKPEQKLLEAHDGDTERN